MDSSSMNTPLDSITMALFATLRGGEIKYQENEYVNIMRTCPLCNSSLECLFLQRFEKDGITYEQMLWRCSKQPSRACYFPMNILPLEVFWTRRTMQQAENGIKPLPNLHLLPKFRQNLYPKLFQPNANGRRIDIESIIKCSSFVPNMQPICSAAASVNTIMEQPIRSPSISNDLKCKLPRKSKSQRSNSNSLTVVDCSPQTSVHEFLKNRLRSQTKMNIASHSQPKLKPSPKKKMVDHCPNTDAALSSHLTLNGTNSAMTTTTGSSGQQQGQQTTNESIVEKELANPLPQAQLRKLRSQMRSALTQLDEAEVENATVGVKKPFQPRQRATSLRYIPSMPRNALSAKQGLIENKLKLGRRPKKATKSISDANLKKVIQQLDLRNIQETIPTRLGIIPSSERTFSNSPIPDEVVHYELHEGLPDDAAHTPSLDDNNSVDRGSTRTTETSTIGSNSSGKRRRWGGMEEGKTKKQKTTDNASQKPIEPEYFEMIRQKQQVLLSEAIRRRATSRSRPKSTKAPYESAATLQHQYEQSQPQMMDSSNNYHFQTELTGIPHDFNESADTGVVAAPRTSAEFMPIDHGNGSPDRVNQTFASYDRFGMVTEVTQQSSLATAVDDEFDFGFGLESEFMNADGSGYINEQVMTAMNGENSNSAADFLRRLGRG